MACIGRIIFSAQSLDIPAQGPNIHKFDMPLGRNASKGYWRTDEGLS